MRTQSIRLWQLALMLMVSATAIACGDSSSGGDDDAPDLTGNNSDGDNNGDNNTGADNGGTTANGGDSNAGTNAPEDKCVKSPKTSADFLNQCAPAGVERRTFNNAERLPSTYKPGEDLPPFP